MCHGMAVWGAMGKLLLHLNGKTHNEKEASNNVMADK